MNVAHIKLTDCKDCKFCDDNGDYGYTSKGIWVCKHQNVQKNKTTNKDIKHWYDYAVIAPKRVRTPDVPIPDWCPFVEKI